MKIEDNHYTYRIETKDSNGGSLDFIDIDTVEPLRCAYDVQDELNLETNEHIKRVEEIVLNANSTEFWYVDEARTSDTHLVCYFEEVQLMASKDHPMVDTNRSVFEYGKINSNEYQNTNFICTHVMDNGVSRIYMSIDKETFEFATFNNETIKHFISNNPVTVWYALRYEIIIPRSMSKGHLLTLDGQTDITLTTTSEQNKLPIMKFNIGDTQYTLDTNPIHINSTQEGTQIRNIVLEGNTPINYARGNGVNTTEATSNTRYDFEPFYDGQATIQGTVDGGYVSAKLYGDTMVNIAKPYGETPLLTATNESTLCDDLLGMNEEGIVLADGEITDGRIYGDSLVNIMVDTSITIPIDQVTNKGDVTIEGMECWYLSGNNTQVLNLVQNIKPNTTYTIKALTGASSISATVWDMHSYNGSFYTKIVVGNSLDIPRDGTLKEVVLTITIPSDAVKITLDASGGTYFAKGKFIMLEGEYTEQEMRAIPYFSSIGSVVNPTVYSVNENLFDFNILKNGTTDKSYIEIPLNIQQGVKYHYMDDYGQWNGSGIYSATLTGVREDDSTVTFAQFINSGGSNRVYQNFTVSTTNKYKKITLRFPLATRDTVLSKVTKMGVFKGEFYDHEITPHKHTQATFPYTLNKLPNGVADYIDVVNKVHVQMVGVVEDASTLTWYGYINLDNTYTCYFLHDKLPQIAKNSTTFLCIGVENRNSTTIDKSLYSAGNMSLLTFAKDTTPLVSYDVEGFKAKLSELGVEFLYELATPIYTPLTEEEIAQLPLSAYADGYVNLSSDQLMPSFEFRMKASNRYQVDMLDTGYYYLNAPTGNIKLGTANVDVQQMPCIVKVDNVGSGDSGYRLGINGEQLITHNLNLYDEIGYLNNSGQVELGTGVDNVTPYMLVGDTVVIRLSNINNISSYAYSISYYDENKKHIRTVIDTTISNAITAITGIGSNVKYIRISMQLKTIITKNPNAIVTINSYPITLAKLPSHRIPTSFTQGMKCGTDFGYWEGIKVATGKQLYVSDTNKTEFSAIELNRIEYNNTIVEDEFDIATGKLTKRIGKYTIDGNSNLWVYSKAQTETSTHMSFGCSNIPNFKKGGKCIGFLNLKEGAPNSTGSYECWSNLGVLGYLYFRFKKDRYSRYGEGANGVKGYFNANPTTIYYELEVPEISYVDLPLNTLRTLDATTTLQVANQSTAIYLIPQVKPSHLTYPIPSLVGNRTYTVVHNRKNITGSTKPIELNLGGTVVQLNDASSKTLVKTPSTLAHSNLIFIGGESTVDHIMVLDGDWTNKPIEYFENMKGHDTDAIITIIGDGKIEDVAEQYLW